MLDCISNLEKIIIQQNYSIKENNKSRENNSHVSFNTKFLNYQIKSLYIGLLVSVTVRGLDSPMSHCNVIKHGCYACNGQL